MLFAIIVLSVSLVFAESDISTYQGQYYIDDEFQVGTFEFEFNAYDDAELGDLLYSKSINITTGQWGQWYAELEGVSRVLNNVSKDYFMEIVIDGVPQIPRRRITDFNFLRKDVDEVTNGSITSQDFVSAKQFSQSADSDELQFVDNEGSNWLSFARASPLFSERNVTSIYLTDEEGVRKNAGISYYINEENRTIPWLWSNIDQGGGGLVLLTDQGIISPEKEHRVLGRFSQDALALGSGTDLDINAEFSKGMDFIIYGDDQEGKAFFVDSNNDYFTTINADLNVTGNSYFNSLNINGRNVCLDDGTNCLEINLTPYYTKLETDLKLTNYTLKSELNYFSGNYEDLINKPLIPIDTKLSEAEVDLFVDNNGYLTSYTETDSIWNSEKDNYYTKLATDLKLANYTLKSELNYFSGNYDDLINKPLIPIDTRLSEAEVDLFVDNNGYLTSYTETDSIWNSEKDNYYTKLESDLKLTNYTLKSELNYFSGNYEDLINKPLIPIDTKLSEAEVDLFVNNNGYLTSYTETDSVWNSEKNNYYNKTEIDEKISGDDVKMPFTWEFTSRGSLSKSSRYLSMGTESTIGKVQSRSAWINGMDVVITGAYWASHNNRLKRTSNIILYKGDKNKGNFYQTPLSLDISSGNNGIISGLNLEIDARETLSLEYKPSSGEKGRIEDLSLTIVGYYR